MNHRVAVAIEQYNSSPLVAEHFGRCSEILVYEIKDHKIIKKEIYPNPLIGQHSGVCELPGHISQFEVNTIIAGGMGRKAVSNFQQFGIEVITAPGLKSEEAVQLFIQGELKGYTECAGHEHSHH